MRSLLRTDIFERGVPWTVLLWREARARSTSEPLLATGDLLRLPDPALARQPLLLDLNLQTSNRAERGASPRCWPLAAGRRCCSPRASGRCRCCWRPLLLALNWRLYVFFAQRRGPAFSLAAIPWHWLYYLYNSLSFALGTLHFWLRGARPVAADGALPRAADPETALDA